MTDALAAVDALGVDDEPKRCFVQEPAHLEVGRGQALDTVNTLQQHGAGRNFRMLYGAQSRIAQLAAHHNSHCLAQQRVFPGEEQDIIPAKRGLPVKADHRTVLIQPG